MNQFENQAIETAVIEILDMEKVDYSSKTTKAELLWSTLVCLLQRRKVYQFYRIKGILDVFRAACYLYDLYLDKEKITSFFILRERTASIFSKAGVDKETQDKIFQMCECCLGEDALAEFLIPQKGYPDDLFADALFMCQLIKE